MNLPRFVFRVFTKYPKSKLKIIAANDIIKCNYSNGTLLTTTPIPEITEKYPNFTSHEDIYNFSIEQPETFWSILAKERLYWQKPFTQSADHDLQAGKFRWFPDGIINVSENCVDRHAEKHPDKVALIWEKDEPGKEEKMSYRELKELVCRISNVLKDSGVNKGDRVAIYLPVMPFAVATMLACTRIGAIHSIVFAGFSAEALASRIMDAQAETVITADQAIRGGKIIELKKTVDEAVSRLPCVKRVFVASRTGAEVQKTSKDIDIDKALATASPNCPASPQNAEDILFILYTSGSTGKPKGIAHSTAGYLLYASVTHKHVFDYKENDIYGCVADVGWITGHSYVVYGPLANGATTVLFESTPTYPDPGRYWDTVSRLRINQFYCAPTAIRLLLRSGDSWPAKYDLSSLRVLGSVGEPINQEAWHWFNEVIGKKRCDVVDTWWQTETGGIMISPRPSAPKAKISVGMPMRPMFGIRPELLDLSGNIIRENKVDGALCIKSIWPGIARTVYGDHQRYLETYFKPYPGYFFSGDAAVRDDEGFYQMSGRMDDVINVTGHRLGTAEVEDVMNEHISIAETAVVGFPHEIKGEGIYAFVTLKDKVDKSQDQIMKEGKAMVRSQIAAYAVPEKILIVPGLPKTRSGKIMRRILRKVAANQYEDLGDTSTLADPSVVETILKLHKNTFK